jgi:hypothetical protein
VDARLQSDHHCDDISFGIRTGEITPKRRAVPKLSIPGTVGSVSKGGICPTDFSVSCDCCNRRHRTDGHAGICAAFKSSQSLDLSEIDDHMPGKPAAIWFDKQALTAGQELRAWVVHQE